MFADSNKMVNPLKNISSISQRTSLQIIAIGKSKPAHECPSIQSWKLDNRSISIYKLYFEGRMNLLNLERYIEKENQWYSWSIENFQLSMRIDFYINSNRETRKKNYYQITS